MYTQWRVQIDPNKPIIKSLLSSTKSATSALTRSCLPHGGWTYLQGRPLWCKDVSPRTSSMVSCLWCKACRLSSPTVHGWTYLQGRPLW